MNGLDDINQPSQNPQTPVAFCQNCGLPLTPETVRRVGPAVYCEPCLAARLAGTPPAPGASGGYGPVNAGPYTSPINGAPYSTGEPNPGLAALLGLIPGVGAMYNEQYAKGIVHLLIFVVLVSLSHANGIFDLFVIGWVFYMAIEAHHTAKARRDGTPLPNPFGLNDIGERMGFGKAWPAGPDVAAAARDAVHAATSEFINTAHAGFGRSTPPPSTATPPPQPGQPTPADAPPWGAPIDAYPPQPTGYVPPYYSQPYPPNYAYTPPVPPYAPAYVPPAATIPPVLPPRNRFPAGAVWLIGLGMIFLLGTMGIFNAVPGSALVGVILLVLGVWIFLRRMLESGASLAFDGTSGYQLRLFRALRGSIWLIAFGVFALLLSFRLVSWYYSWPWLIIFLGVWLIVQRAAYNAAVSAIPMPPRYAPAAEPVETSAPAPDSHEGSN